jgi:Ca2+-binding EF-hand superfamily protein
MERFGIKGLTNIQKCIIQVADMIEKSKVTLRQAFQIIDKDRNGKLDRNELRTAFNKMGIRMSDQELFEFID